MFENLRNFNMTKPLLIWQPNIFPDEKKEIAAKYFSMVILRDLVNYKLKLDDAPCSAETHLDHAIFLLSE